MASPPDDVTLTQTGPMSITISWTPPPPLSHTTGYRVYYKPLSDTEWDNTTVSDPTATTVCVTGLSSEQYYSVSIMSLSLHFPSEMVQNDIYLCKLSSAHHDISCIYGDNVNCLTFQLNLHQNLKSV